MTHTLHRRGSAESLKEDYVVLIARAQGIYAPCRECLHRKFPHLYALIRRVALKLGIIELLEIGRKFGVTVFNNKAELVTYLEKLKEKKRKTGISVVVSGLFNEVNDCLNKLNLSPHTVIFSLGHLGKTELLPREEVLEITTMCGHHMVSPKLVEKLASDIKNGKIAREEAVRVMANQCVCAAFNQTRAAKLMKALTK